MRRIVETSILDLVPNTKLGKGILSATIAFPRRLRQALPLSLSLRMHVRVQALFFIKSLSRY